jgi:hypothetical protein
VKAVDVIEDERQRNENHDEGEGGGHCNEKSEVRSQRSEGMLGVVERYEAIAQL